MSLQSKETRRKNENAKNVELDNVQSRIFAGFQQSRLFCDSLLILMLHLQLVMSVNERE